MPKTLPHWNAEVETMPREDLEALQTDMLRDVVDRAYRKSPFYRDLYRKAGVTPRDIRSLEDVRRLPFVDKELADRAYPFGMLMCDRSRLRQVHAATTPSRQILPIWATEGDLDQWAERCARILWMVGLRPGERLQSAFRFGLSTGGFGFHLGAQRMGMTSIPASIGGTDRQIDLLVDLGVEGIAMMPSYGLFLGMRALERGIDLAHSNLRVGLFGAEPTSTRMKSRLAQLMGIRAYGEYGMNEFLGPGMACHCPYKKGMHAWADQFLLECIDPETGEPVPEGNIGELVWTWLNAEATAVIRFRSHDLSRVIWKRCRCGRTHPRVRRILGRTDGALSIGGFVVYPSRLQDVMSLFPEVGPFQVILDSVRGLDGFSVSVELRKGVRTDEEALSDRIRSAVCSYLVCTPDVQVVPGGTLGLEGEDPPFRIIDYRRFSGRYGAEE